MLQPSAQPGDALDVEALLGFVHHQQLARTHQGGRQGEPAPLATGQRAGQLSRLRDELHLIEHLVDQRVGIGQSVGTREQIEMLDDRQVGEKIQVVHDGGDIAAECRVGFADLASECLDPPLTGTIGADDAAQDDRLTGAVASGHCHSLTRVHSQVESVDDHMIAIFLHQVGHLEDRLALGHGSHCGLRTQPVSPQVIDMDGPAACSRRTRQRKGRTRRFATG